MADDRASNGAKRRRVEDEASEVSQPGSGAGGQEAFGAVGPSSSEGISPLSPPRPERPTSLLQVSYRASSV